MTPVEKTEVQNPEESIDNMPEKQKVENMPEEQKGKKVQKVENMPEKPEKRARTTEPAARASQDSNEKKALKLK
jgi:hypothetical protein